MVFESLLFGGLLAATSVVFFWIGCAKKAAPSVQPKAPTPSSNVSMSKSPVSKSPAKDKDLKEDDEKKKEEEEPKEPKEAEKKNEEEEKKEDGDDKEGDKDKEKKKKSKSNEKDDEKKEEKKTEEEEGKKEKTEEDDGKKKEPQISVNPAELRFETTTTSQKKLRLKNLTDKKLMFKIKASTTNTYLINPVFGKIEPNNFAEVMITHRPSAKRDDKLVIITSEFIGKELEMAKTFKHIKSGGADVTVRLVSY